MWGKIHRVAFLSDPWGVATREFCSRTLELILSVLHFYLTRGELQQALSLSILMSSFLMLHFYLTRGELQL